VLRLGAMSGRLGESRFSRHEGACAGARIICLEAAPAKDECPVGVDRPAFKKPSSSPGTLLAGGHGTPIRARMLGHIHELCRDGPTIVAPLANGSAGKAIRCVGLKRTGCSARSPPD